MTVPLGVRSRIPVEHLRLDSANPRLIGHSAADSDEAIIANLYRAAELDELLQSISANGYLDIEPLVVTQEGDDCRSVVLEGNRRLAALRLLRERALVERLATSWDLRIDVPKMTPTRRRTMDEVSVYAVENRETARPFLGFKHINGPAKWDAYAKAKFAKHWYDEERSKGVTINDIANAIGDRHDTIKRMVAAVYVLEQAERLEVFKVTDRLSRRFNFSHLYTALGRSQYMDYLGLGRKWARFEPRPDPVPLDKTDNLRSVLVWIYGSKSEDKRPVVQAQNPDVKRLGAVLVSPEARHVLSVTGSLDDAHAQTEPVDSRFTESLIRGRNALRAAVSSLRAYDGQDKSMLDIAEDAKETADTIWLRMSRKFHDAARNE